MPSIQQGQIIWAKIPDPNGYVKPNPRPGVVLQGVADADPDTILYVVAGTTNVPNPLPTDHVALPYSNQSRCHTGLTRETAIVCTWLVEIRYSDIEGFAGRVNQRDLTLILEKIGL